MRTARVLAALLPALCSGLAAVQAPPNLNGRVIDAFTLRPIAGAIVETGDLRTVTDPDGRFRLTLPRGTTRISVSAERYLTDQVEVAIAEAPVTIEVVLLDRSQFKEDVVVRAGAAPATVSPAAVEVSPLQVRSVAGGGENVFRALQTLPGVNATEDFGSRLAVRGGGPDQNLTIMDGVEIHDPYRLFGLTSAFNPETIENFQLTAGGFSPKYGDRLSSILLIENRAGTRQKRLAGSAALSLTDANVILEGRLPFGVNGSWLVTGRRTYYDLVADRITGQDLPSFGDVQVKGVWETRPGQSLSLFVLRSRETTDARFTNSGNAFGLKDTAQNDEVSLAFATTLWNRLSSRTIAAWYRYGDGLSADGNVKDEASRSNAPGDEAFARSSVQFSRDLGVMDISVRQEFAIRAARAHVLETGFEAHALETSWGWNIAGDRNTSEANGSSTRGGTGLPSLLDSRQNTVRAGAWLLDQYRVSPGLIIEPGVRFDWIAQTGEAIVSPRISGEIGLGVAMRLRAATGLFVQSPGYEKLLQADYFVDLTSPGATNLRSERSVHLLGALERDLASGVLLRVEGYYKSFDRLIIGRRETPAETAARIALYQFPPELASSVPIAPQILSLPVNGATGRAYGFDVYVAHRPSVASERFSGWASYTWGRADRNAYGRIYPFDYDRRHAFSFVGSYRAARWFELGATVRAASGFPYSPVVGLRVAPASILDEAGNVVAYVPARDPNGLLVWTTDLDGVGNLNAGRLPVFARVDLRATFKPSWWRNRFQIYGEVINTLNRKNAGALEAKLLYDPSSDRPRLTLSPTAFLPLLPSVGLRFQF